MRRKTGETVTGRPAVREERDRGESVRGSRTNEQGRLRRLDELGAGCKGVPSCCLMSSWRLA